MSRPVVPIANLARRIPEAGRIRTGVKSGRAMKAIETFRFTSSDRTAIEQVAERYGGEPRAWKDAPTPGQWEVITEASEIRVVLPPDPLGGTPIYELWSGGGCQRRCDGETCQVIVQGPDGAEPDEVPCMCSAKEEMACTPHTRLSVILPDVRFAGTWRYESAKSWNVAQEMPGMVELIQSLQARGLTRAVLAIEHRKSVAGGQTRRFTVPKLRVDETLDALAAGAAQVGSLPSAAAGELPAPERPVEAPQELPGPAYDLDDEVVEAELVEEVDRTGRHDEDVPTAPLATKAQMRMLHALLRGDGIETDEDRHAWATKALGRDITSMAQVTKAEASHLIDGFKAAAGA